MQQISSPVLLAGFGCQAVNSEAFCQGLLPHTSCSAGLDAHLKDY